MPQSPCNPMFVPGIGFVAFHKIAIRWSARFLRRKVYALEQEPDILPALLLDQPEEGGRW